MEFLMAMQHIRLDSVVSGDKKEVPAADRTISRDCLNAHYGNFKGSETFCCLESDFKLAEDRC